MPEYYGQNRDWNNAEDHALLHLQVLRPYRRDENQCGSFEELHPDADPYAEGQQTTETVLTHPQGKDLNNRLIISLYYMQTFNGYVFCLMQRVAE